MLALGQTTPGSGALAMSVSWPGLPTELKDAILDFAVPDELQAQLSYEMRGNTIPTEFSMSTTESETWEIVFALLCITKTSRKRTMKRILDKATLYITELEHHPRKKSLFKSLAWMDNFHTTKIGIIRQDRIWDMRLRASVSAMLPRRGEPLTPVDVKWGRKANQSPSYGFVLTNMKSVQTHFLKFDGRVESFGVPDNNTEYVAVIQRALHDLITHYVGPSKKGNWVATSKDYIWESTGEVERREQEKEEKRKEQLEMKGLRQRSSKVNYW